MLCVIVLWLRCLGKSAPKKQSCGGSAVQDVAKICIKPARESYFGHENCTKQRHAASENCKNMRHEKLQLTTDVKFTRTFFLVTASDL